MQTMELNHQWTFSSDNEDSYASRPIPEGLAVALPHCWNDKDGQGGNEDYWRGQCWYQRTLDISPEQLRKRLYLEIGAAGNIGKVYINGRLAGESR